MIHPYKVNWYLPNRVLLITVNGDLGEAGTRQMESESFQYIRTANNVIHAIVDLRYLEDHPPHISQAFWQIKRPKHPNQGVSVIIVPMNPVVKFITNTVMTAMNLKVEFCKTFIEAELAIAKLEKKRKKGSARNAKI